VHNRGYRGYDGRAVDRGSEPRLPVRLERGGRRELEAEEVGVVGRDARRGRGRGLAPADHHRRDRSIERGGRGQGRELLQEARPLVAA
jgi:hypothetical protein